MPAVTLSRDVLRSYSPILRGNLRDNSGDNLGTITLNKASIYSYSFDSNEAESARPNSIDNSIDIQSTDYIPKLDKLF